MDVRFKVDDNTSNRGEDIERCRFNEVKSTAAFSEGDE